MELELPLDKTVKIVNWKVKEGHSIHPGNIIFEYVECGLDGAEREAGTRHKFKATQPGVIRKILAEKGANVSKGTKLLLLDPAEQCTHPIVMHDMCGVCSQDLRKLDDHKPTVASVAMVHSVPGLKVSMEEAQMLGKLDEQHLIKERKLVLLVDLDQTLIHTTNDNVPHNLENVFHFQLRSHGSVWYHTRLRPGTQEFLEKMNKYFQLHICTFGTRQYANTIAQYLDPKGKFFSDRILSRDECFSHNSKTANLKELFPRGDHMVCIIDDREDVWSFATNLIHVKPYHFFRHTGDINAPPGLSKKDDDDKVGFEFPNDMDKAVCKSTGETSEASVPEDNNSQVQNPVETESQKDESSVIETNSRIEIEAGEILEEVTSVDENKNKDEPSDTDKDINSVSDPSACNNVPDLETKSVCIDSNNLKLVNQIDETETSINKDESAATGLLVDAGESIEKEQVNNVSETLEKSGEKVVDADDTNVPTEAEKMEVEETENPDANSGADLCVESKNGNESLAEETEVEKETKNLKISDVPLVSGIPDTNESDETNMDVDTSGLGNSTAQNSVTKIENPDVIKVEDPDDYLMYLEEILLSIYKAYYDLYDGMVQKGKPGVPDVKTVIPYVRQKVLKGTSIVFSGVIPTQVPLEKSRQYAIAVSLGAHVSSKIIPPRKSGSTVKPNEPPTTHVVAAREGTAKVNEARKHYKSIHIVTPDWLWSCAERWERSDEKIFLLFKQKKFKRNPPAHCSSPDQSIKPSSDSEYLLSLDGSIACVAGPSTSRTNVPAGRKERTPSGRFMDTINPLLSFSMDDLERMDHEVDDIFNESDSSSTEEEGEVVKDRQARKKKCRPSPPTVQQKPKVDKESSSNDDTENENEGSTSVVLGKRKRSPGRTETETEDEPLSTRFRRGEPLPSDLDTLNLLSGSSDEDDNGQEDQEDWMAEALEREFLDENSQSQDTS